MLCVHDISSRRALVATVPQRERCQAVSDSHIFPINPVPVDGRHRCLNFRRNPDDRRDRDTRLVAGSPRPCRYDDRAEYCCLILDEDQALDDRPGRRRTRDQGLVGARGDSRPVRSPGDRSAGGRRRTV